MDGSPKHLLSARFQCWRRWGFQDFTPPLLLPLSGGGIDLLGPWYWFCRLSAAKGDVTDATTPEDEEEEEEEGLNFTWGVADQHILAWWFCTLQAPSCVLHGARSVFFMQHLGFPYYPIKISVSFRIAPDYSCFAGRRTLLLASPEEVEFWGMGGGAGNMPSISDICDASWPS